MGETIANGIALVKYAIVDVGKGMGLAKSIGFK
jgi:hypothetical protein